MSTARFSYSQAELRALTADILVSAKAAGASACECEIAEAHGDSVSVRRGEVETIEYHRDKSAGITVYFGQRKGHASSSDLSVTALRETVSRAAAIARYTAADECAGLAEPAELARSAPELLLYHPWEQSTEAAIELARACEASGFAVDPNIDNSEGATVSRHHSQFARANSAGFSGGFALSRHSIGCGLIAGSGDAMQRDEWYSVARDPAALEAAELVGRRAGERTVRRLGARKIGTCSAPVLFDPPVAAGLIGHFVAAASGGALYRKSSFLSNGLGQSLFPPHFCLWERPFLPGALASAPFDDDGVAAQDRAVVQDGVVNGYFLSVYSARKLGLRSTGNAGGCHNLVLRNDGKSQAELLREMGRGLFVTELMGQGVNLTNGDYSRGAAGFWVEGGELAYPVHEITIAGNLKDMYRAIQAVGNDVLIRGAAHCCSILIDGMKIAGD